jgi:hypothetical protein
LLLILEPPAAILVIGGDSNRQVELVDLSPGGGGRGSCVSPVLSPHQMNDADGIFVDGKPTICGGTDTDFYLVKNECYSLDLDSGAWNQIESLTETRKGRMND